MHVPFPSIEQFKNITSEIFKTYSYVGLDENNKAIYDYSQIKPILKFKGTVKLHGTNAAVCFNNQDGFWFQSRQRIITLEEDNAGFAQFATNNIKAFSEFVELIKTTENIEPTDTISIFGEWCGKGIQKKVAISNIEKSFFIFGVKISKENKDKSKWVDHSYLKCSSKRIYNINDYDTYSIEIDFNNPKLVQNTLVDITSVVENRCPVGFTFGFDGVGEGVVWTSCHEDKTYRFKVKGEKHSASKVSVLKTIDENKIVHNNLLVEKLTPVWRLEQMLQESCDLLNGGTVDRTFLGDFIKLVFKDIEKEEQDILEGIKMKDISKEISNVCKQYFLNQEEQSVP